MKTSEASGQAIRALDGAHLNNAGNELLGEKLAAEIFRMRKER